MAVEVRSVLMTADAVGGVWTHAVELSWALSARGIRVTLAVMGPRPSAAQRAEVRSIPGLSLAEGPFRLEWMDDPWPDVDAASAWLLGLERAAQPDVVHLNGMAHGCVPFFAPVVAVGHSCVLSWFDQVKNEPAPSRYAEYRRRVARGLRCASAVVAPSAAMMAALQRFYGPLARAQVIHNAERVASRAAGAQEPFILAAGRLWDEAKNLRALESAAAEVRWPIRVAGDVEHPGGGRVEARGLQLLGRLRKDELLAEMSRAAIFASPARYEPFGLAVLEAAHAGCALVLSDIPSFRELWDGCAEFVQLRDPAALSAALQRLIADPDRRVALARAARARAGRFDPARMADAYLDVYRSAAARPEPHGAAA